MEAKQCCENANSIFPKHKEWKEISSNETPTLMDSTQISN